MTQEVFTDIDSLSKKSGDHYEEQCSLCYEVFFNSTAGKRLLSLWEHKYFYEPVAPWNQSNEYARCREGENNFLRMIRTCAAQHKKEPLKPTTVKREVAHGTKA